LLRTSKKSIWEKKKKSLKSGEELGNGIWLTGGFEKWIGQKCLRKEKKSKRRSWWICSSLAYTLII
jgi:hypothetical protein